MSSTPELVVTTSTYATDVDASERVFRDRWLVFTSTATSYSRYGGGGTCEIALTRVDEHRRRPGTTASSLGDECPPTLPLTEEPLVVTPRGRRGQIVKLDRGAPGSIADLRMEGERVLWMHDGKQRSAALPPGAG